MHVLCCPSAEQFLSAAECTLGVRQPKLVNRETCEEKQKDVKFSTNSLFFV
jgi:hypothetical protein